VARQKPRIEKQGAMEVPGSSPDAAERRLRPSQCAAYLRRELAHSFRGIVHGFVQQATSGSVPHMKETMHLLDSQTTPKKRKGSAQRLLEELERMDGDAAGTAEAEGDDAWRD